MKSIGFIGGGRITRILLKGFSKAGVTFKSVSVYEPNPAALNLLKSDFPAIRESGVDFSEAVSCDWVFLSVHPPVLMETLSAISNNINKDALVISLAPKITLNKMASVLKGVPNLARMNPNAGTLVNKGFNPVCFLETTENVKKEEFIKLFEKIGKTPQVPEHQIEAYAVISAMGHTYFWFQLQHLRALGLSYGLTQKESEDAITTMLWGTTETLFNAGLSYEEVVDLVPVKPLAEHENTIREIFTGSLNGIYQKIKPA